MNHFFSNPFGDPEAFCLICNHVFRIIRRGFRKDFQDFINENISPLSGHGRDGNDLFEMMKSLILIYDGEEVFSFPQIHFIDDQERDTLASFEEFYHLLIFFHKREGRLDKKAEDDRSWTPSKR